MSDDGKGQEAQKQEEERKEVEFIKEVVEFARRAEEEKKTSGSKDDPLSIALFGIGSLIGMVVGIYWGWHQGWSYVALGALLGLLAGPVIAVVGTFYFFYLGLMYAIHYIGLIIIFFTKVL